MKLNDGKKPEGVYEMTTFDVKAAEYKMAGSDHKYMKFPGFCDVHVHFREPGFSYKETIKTGAMAAAHGGYTAVCTMPNLDPVPDSLEHLKVEEDIIKRDALIGVYPYAAITIGEKGEKLAGMEELASRVVAFSDDGKGVQSESMMREAMQRAKALGKMIVAHCEVNELLHGGYIHDGSYARAHGHKGICSESEWQEIKRDLRLAKETGCAYHVCHISCKESVDLIRKAKAEGTDVTCETAPHYLLMDETYLREDGRFKMNPPLRSEDDRKALIQGIQDGTIDCIATDHAPHSEAEKAKGLKDSAMGIVGIETAFPLLYTGLVHTGVISMERLLELICFTPRARFGLPVRDDYTIWDMSEECVIDSEKFLSKGKITPFDGWKVLGRCMKTVHAGNVAYEEACFDEAKLIKC